MATLLEVSEVDQIFRSGFWMKPVQVLHGVNLEVPRGSVFGFLGANGAGKTTLIHLIVGLKQPKRGFVRIAGKDAWTPEARAKIGYLPERPYFHEHLTGEAFLTYFGTLSGLGADRIRARIPTALADVGMAHAGQLELRKYSKGMLQRIGIAQAILHDPEFLILDEPMSGLDPVGRKEMRELIQRLAQEGRTIFFSSHVIPDVEAICDQVALIQKGRLIGSGPISQFLAKGPVQTEIVFSGPSLDAVRTIAGLESARAIPEGIRAQIPDRETITPVLEKLLKLDAKIAWVTPNRPSLESFFGEEGFYGGVKNGA